MLAKASMMTMLLAASTTMVGAADDRDPRSSGGPYVLDWYTIDGGGGTSTGGALGQYQLTGTVGQHDADTSLGGGAYDVMPGFWHGVETFCAADVDNDGDADVDDIEIFVDLFLDGIVGNADMDGDGDEQVDDIDIFVIYFLNGC